LDIHEYQAKGLLSGYGVGIPSGKVACSADEAQAIARELGGSGWVVKAQIHAGDRGKVGGVKRCATLDEVLEAAAGLIGSTLVTPQTGSDGQRVHAVYVEQACEFQTELYLGMLVDGATSRLTLLSSSQGGTGIESDERNIHSTPIDPGLGLTEEQLQTHTRSLGLVGEQAQAAEQLMRAIYDAFNGLDASLIEINPLVVTSSGGLLALDAKMSIDDNALFRHPELEKLRLEEQDPARLERERHGFNYVRLDGNIGCLVTGAGLALATLDLLKLYGGEPANFIDLPPTARRVQIAAAFKLILNEPKVKCILVNVVGGGFTRCDVVAEGITTAAREVSVDVPVVVRLSGTSWEMGRNLLQNSRMQISYADNMTEAAAKAIEAAKGAA
jgi:succinyl-CoA synthetase beta subunit